MNNDNMVRTDKQLGEIFSAVGKEYDTNATAEFIALKDFKVKWTRDGGISFMDVKVSDYVRDAPRDVVTGLAHMIFRQVTGNGNDEESRPHIEFFEEYVNSPDFVYKNQDRYIRRHRAFERLPYASKLCNRVNEIHKSLSKAGLVEYNPRIAYLIGKTKRKSIECSMLMKVVQVCPSMDDWTDRELAESLLRQYVTINGTYGRNSAHATLDRVDDALMRMRSMSDEELNFE